MYPIKLKTKRLLLRPWRPSDVDDALAYASDPEWARYLWNTPEPYTRRDAEEFIARAVRDDWKLQAQFAIEFEGRAVGGIRLYVIDATARLAGLGYNLARTLWGKGLTTEAAAEVLAYAFETLGLEEVTSAADARNTASIRVMEKLGMRREALLLRHRLHRGEYIDEVHYSILAADWQARRGQRRAE
jgi:RimJ/RimL family protein N-acetyltransferase